MAYDLVVKGGRIVNPSGEFYGDIGIRGEKIAAIGENLSGKRILHAEGKLVTPGAVDSHVHLEMPIGKYISSDDFYHGSRAAACGGTTSFIDFVESLPGESLTKALEKRKSAARDRVVGDYAFHMTLGPEDLNKLDQIPDAVAAGCRSFKLYMAYGLRLDDGQLLRAIEAIGRAGALPVVHAENWDVITTLIEGNLKAGRLTPPWHPRCRPAELEAEAVSRVISIASYLNTRVHIFHISCPEAIRAVEEARTRGAAVTAETCPQYLFLTRDLYEQPGVKGALSVCSPPLRSRESRDSLWSFLSRGSFTTISTDHCPFLIKEKAAGLARFDTIPGGVPSIEMRFSALYSKGVKEGLLTESQWVDLCCSAPARLFGLEAKGTIEQGKDADLVIFDPEKKKVLTSESLHETAGWTPYEGMVLSGWPETVLSRGEVIVEHDSCCGEKGRGKYML